MGGTCVRHGECRNPDERAVGGDESKRLLGKPKCRWEDNVFMLLKVAGCKDVVTIQVVQFSAHGMVLMYMIMKFRVQVRISRIAEQLSFFKKNCVLWYLIVTYLEVHMVIFLSFRINYAWN
jgi:hypothetical protein